MFAKFLKSIGIGNNSEEKTAQPAPSDLSFNSPPSYAESVRGYQLGQARNGDLLDSENLLNLETDKEPSNAKLLGLISLDSSLVNRVFGDGESKLHPNWI